MTSILQKQETDFQKVSSLLQANYFSCQNEIYHVDRANSPSAVEREVYLNLIFFVSPVILMFCELSPCTEGADKSLARPTSWCILFDGENISFDASLVLYIYINSTNIPQIMIVNRIYETQKLLSRSLFPSRSG